MASDDTLSVGIEFFDEDSGQISLRQVGLGLQPLLLVEPGDLEDPDSPDFQVSLSLIDQEQARVVFAALADVFKNGNEVED